MSQYRVYSLLQGLQAAHPELRVSQLISNLFDWMEHNGVDPFYAEDDEFAACVAEYMREIE